MSGCDSCHDAAKQKNRAIADARITAQTKSNEEKIPIAICKELTTNEYFCVAATTAFANQFAVMEIVSAVQPD